MRVFFKYVMICLAVLDILVLRAVSFLLDWCSDWFSWSRKWMERGIIMCWLVAESLWWFGGAKVRFNVTIYACNTAWCFWLLWSCHRWSDERRVETLYRLWFFRVLGLLFLTLIGVMVAWESSRLVAVFHSISWACLALIMYATSLPSNNGRGGRRRKLAMDKVKEMFGTGWMPVPLGEGH